MEDTDIITWQTNLIYVIFSTHEESPKSIFLNLFPYLTFRFGLAKKVFYANSNIANFQYEMEID